MMPFLVHLRHGMRALIEPSVHFDPGSVETETTRVSHCLLATAQVLRGGHSYVWRVDNVGHRGDVQTALGGLSAKSHG